ncbi:MAG: S9 family peptidase [Proteobacteria bacterium]|nr:S9 family peptidase [Pseudomonadota bacterium]
MSSDSCLPPVAKRARFEHTYHNKTFEDSYHWLRQPLWTQETGVTDEEILTHLKQENAYTENFFNLHKETVDKINQELCDLIDIDFETYPISEGLFSYFTKTPKGKNYEQHFRKNKQTDTVELLLDENLEAEGKEYFSLGIFSPSHDHRYIAMAFDYNGSERYSLKIFDTTTKTYLPLTLNDVSSNGLVWNNEGTRFFFQKVDANWRSNTVYYFDLFEKDAKEMLVFEEKDTKNHVSIGKSSDSTLLLISVGEGESNEVHIQDVNTSEICLKTPFKRQPKIKYSLDSQEGHYILLINDRGPHKRLLRFKPQEGDIWNYVDPIFNDSEVSDLFLIGTAVYKNALLILAKQNGMPKLLMEQNKVVEEISLNYKSFTLNFAHNDYNDDYGHLIISSLVQPQTEVFLDLKTKALSLKHTRSIPGFDPSLFETDRLEATSLDGVKVPYTIAYKKTTHLKNAPVYLYGYGSYGYALDPNFRASYIPLLERGYIVAIAHIRGGGDLGRHWYEASKFKTKKKTFEDFIACAKDLINKGYTSKQNISIAGGSAGGMLVGAVINMEPDLFKSAVAMVPFVDVINSMMDDSLPLTPGEYNEWGNPHDKNFFDYMKTYSPYDNVEAKNYPALYVTAGLNDPRVTYWEPAKWVAKLRYLKTDKNILLLETEMSAGHGGPSGKFNELLEIARRYTFILNAKREREA